LQGLRQYPDDKRFALELAGVAYRKKDMGEAKKRLREALQLDPADAYGNDFLGTLYLLEDNLPAALKYWNRIGKPLVQTMQLTPVPELEEVLRERTITVSPGQVFTLDRLRTTESNLDRLGVFTGYRFDLAPRQDGRFDLTFQSVPKAQPLRGWPGRILPLVRGLPYQAIHFDRYNLGKRAANLTSLWRWDADKRRIALDFSAPFRLNPRSRYRLLLDARDEDWDLRTTYRGEPGGLDHVLLQKVEAGAEMEFGLTGKLQWTTGLRVAWRRFRNADGSRFFADGWSFHQRNGLDYRLLSWPERRIQVDASALLRTGRVLTGSPSKFASIEGSLNGKWFPQPEGENVSVEVRMRAGRTFGPSPLDELFILGMERDNDLWLRGHTGTRDGHKGSGPLGREYTLFQSEVNRTLFEFAFLRLQAGPFFDTGRIADPSGQFGSRGWMQDAGLQAKIRTLGGVTWTFVYGRDLRDGRGVFYTAVSSRFSR
ncbi:MAG: hypothetical protein ACRD7E_28920, partial [Bryobacteraceae bacterium]